MYNTREFMIINSSQISAVDFEQVLESSPETLRYSIDKTLSLFKWDNNVTNGVPSSIANIPSEYKQGPYNYDEMMLELNTPIWTQSISGLSGV